MRAIVLSAGYGSRLGELADETPKPLLDVEGRPILELILRHLAAHDIREVAVNLHYRPDAIQACLGDGSWLGVNLHYVYEPELLGTAGAVANVGDYLAAEGTFLVQYGDVVTDEHLGALVERHQRLGGLVTILVHQRHGSNSVVAFDGAGKVTTFLERPSHEVLEQTASPWVNSGIAVCEPGVLSRIPRGRAIDLPRDVFPRLVEHGDLYAVPLSGYRCAVDSPRRLEELRAAIASGRCGIAATRR